MKRLTFLKQFGLLPITVGVTDSKIETLSFENVGEYFKINIVGVSENRENIFNGSIDTPIEIRIF